LAILPGDIPQVQIPVRVLAIPVDIGAPEPAYVIALATSVTAAVRMLDLGLALS
jgi:hypothetical protein